MGCGCGRLSNGRTDTPYEWEELETEKLGSESLLLHLLLIAVGFGWKNMTPIRLTEKTSRAFNMWDGEADEGEEDEWAKLWNEWGGPKGSLMETFTSKSVVVHRELCDPITGLLGVGKSPWNSSKTSLIAGLVMWCVRRCS